MGVAFTVAFLGVAIVVLAILGGLFLLGLALLIVYLVQRSKKKKRGEKASKAPLVASIVFFIPPVSVGVIFLVSVIANGFERMTWKNFRDEWKNSSYVTDTGARHDAVDAFLKAADEGDKEAIKDMFTDHIQTMTFLDTQIDEFLAVYPGRLSEGKVGSWGGMSNGMDPAYVNQSGEIELDGEIYHISIGLCYQNSERPDLVGIEYIYIKSEEAYAYEYDTDYTVDSDRTFIRGNFQEYDEFEARVIGPHTYAYVEMDRELTKQQLQEAFDSSRNLKEIIGKIGEPNADCERLGWAVYGLSDGDEYAYAVISYHENTVSKITFDISYYEEEFQK